MTDACLPYAEMVATVEADASAHGLPAEMGESAMMQLVGKGCVVECGEHPGCFVVAESVRFFANASRQTAVTCPLCFEGMVFEQCQDCNGEGVKPDGPCKTCWGEREDVRTCELCDGAAAVTYAQLIIEEARRHADEHPLPWGAVVGHPVYSLAHWSELRPVWRQKIAGARGVPAKGWSLVQLLDGQEMSLADFNGLAWGYEGGGPRGLAVILADALPERFVSFEAALSYVEALPQGEAWELTEP